MTERPELNTFEAALLAELRQYVATGERAARNLSTHRVPATTPTAVPAEPGGWRRRLTTFGAAAASVIAITVSAFALRPEAAFAVDVESDGDVVVTIRSLKDAAGLEDALADEGVEAVVAYDANAAKPAPGAGAGIDRDDSPELEEQTDPRDGDAPPVDAACRSDIGTRIAEDGVTFYLPASAVESDGVLHITTSGSVDEWSAIAVRWDGAIC